MSGPNSSPLAETAVTAAAPQTYGTIVVVGGGCYGSYYVRQLGRARVAGALTWTRVAVVDRDASCLVARGLGGGEVTAPGVEVMVQEWSAFFQEYLAAACAAPRASAADAIVPSPLMPHLMFDWLCARASARWPGRTVRAGAVPEVAGMPWQRGGPDGTRYVSFAEWVCPVNCVEPSTCPKTRSARWWTMPAAVRSYAAAEARAGRAVAGPVIFHCTHRAYGVGMFDTSTAVEADALVAAAAATGAADVLVGTVSHCHGALSVLTIGAGDGDRGGRID